MSAENSPLAWLRTGRAHEAYGPGALFFALAWAGQAKGPVLWFRENWRTERVNPAGIAPFLDPGRLLMTDAQDQAEVLAVTEEALRSGAAPSVIMELSQPIGLTAGRRLQLAAEAGQSTALAIIPEGSGSNAAETRWHCAPVFDLMDSTRQHWELKKNKSGTLRAWDVRWDAASRRLTVVSPAGKRPGSTRAPD